MVNSHIEQFASNKQVAQYISIMVEQFRVFWSTKKVKRFGCENLSLLKWSCICTNLVTQYNLCKSSHKGHSFGCIATVYSLDTVFASCNLDLEFIHCWIVVLLNWFKFCSIFNLSNSRACLLCSLFLESFYQFTTLAFQFFVCIFQIIICCMELRLILDCVLPNINLCEKDEK
jgi:hypothetical protein